MAIRLPFGLFRGRDKKAPTGAAKNIRDNLAMKRELLGSLKEGGMVKKTGAYELHKGEKVIPKKRLYAKYP